MQQPMQVYCTRPSCTEPENTITGDFLNSNPTEILCSNCQMPLILQGNFVALSFIGSGGFGRTFKALDLHFPYTTRVIKQLHPRNTSGQILTPPILKRIEEMFVREAITLDRLRHPQIPRFLAFFPMELEEETGYVQKFFYLVQDYIEGKNLAQELQEKGTFSESEVINILKEILNLLNYIHNYDGTNGVIHRDIKPANIIRCSQDDKLYLIDFGAVKQILQGLEVETTSIVLDPNFAPPEQFAHNRVSPASDLYATATTCLCLLTGITDTRELLFNSSWRVHVPVSDQRFAKALDEMLKRRQEDRPQSAQEVLKILSGEPNSGSHPTQRANSGSSPKPRMLRRFLDWVKQLPRRWRSIISFVFQVSLGIAIAVACYFIFIYKPPSPLFADSDYFSRGEESLIPQLNPNKPSCKEADNLKQEGMKAFKQASSSGGDEALLKKAEYFFTQSIDKFKADPNVKNSCIVDPETFIYQYNSKVAQATSARNLPTIAVVIPNQPDEYNIGLEILRGVAQVLQEQDTKSPLFQILLVGNKNDDQQVKKLAGFISDQNIPEEFNHFNRSQILGVIGRYTSQYLFDQKTNTQQKIEGVGEIYGKKELVLIAPTSTATRTTATRTINTQGEYLHRYVFRTASNDSIAASKLSQYVWDDLKLNNVLIIYDTKNIYSKSLAVEFQSKLSDKSQEGNYDLCDVSASINNALFCKKRLKNFELQALMVAAPNVNYNKFLDIIGGVTSRKVQILAGDNLYKKIENPANKITIAVSFHADKANKNFNDKTEELWRIKKVSWRTMTSYDAMQAFVKALGGNSNPTRRNIYEKLSNASFSAPGATTEVSFDQSHDRKPVEGVGVLVRLNKNKSNPDSDEYGFTLLETPQRNNP